ncbi:glycoside hydrolase family 104 protein [Synechococcus sp. CS-1332]|uniref:glycoside hydrolase family 24 protein n=1 Tax=Synechococcus sp. CS-1332 TaxID=2847972 RepID=UPI00223C331B|nr:glycoside hydrolase family 104 protein [Synechococcus sp. CS-1332]MCT0208166.1 glycoside hydrolase family 104 protein [Synechococcus sp. CS-1332]
MCFRFLLPPPHHQRGPLALVLLLLLPMVQRPLAPLPPAARAVAMPTAQPALAVAVTGGRTGSGPYGVTPERRALLNTIRFAEGTWIGGSQEGYRVLYGGDRFNDLSRHPDIVVRRRYASAAAGAYQFLPATWGQAAEELQLRDFQPASQDQAALHLVQERGALQSFDRQGLTAEVLARLAPEWASLPTLEGVSHYGQPVKHRSELQRFYQRELERLRRLASA